jgi:hypothetical protein
MLTMSQSSEKVKKWRKTTKETLVKALGGKCIICGYCNCTEALDLHHLDPDKKEFGFGKIVANPTNWSNIVNEAKKCVLLCANHHREFHAGLVTLPEILPQFDEQFVTSKQLVKKASKTPCPMCGKMKFDFCITCSKKCAAKRTSKVNWNNIDLSELLQSNTYVQIAELLGVSDMAVRKRAKKLNLQWQVS